MAAYHRVYDSRHLQAACKEPGSAAEPYTLGNRVGPYGLPNVLQPSQVGFDYESRDYFELTKGG